MHDVIEEANSDQRRSRRDRLPHRLVGEGLPDGRLGGEQRRHHGPPTPERSLEVTATPEPFLGRHRPHAGSPPHPVGAGGEQGRCARAHRRTLRAARVQHLLAGGRARRERRALLARDHRRRRRIGAARADRRPAGQAGERRRHLGHLARRTLSSASCCSRPSRPTCDNRTSLLDIIANAGAAIVDVDAKSVTVMLAGDARRLRRAGAGPGELRRGRAASDRARGIT